MINFNGTILDKNDSDLITNRGFLFGDAVFETVKIVENKILFLEDHYFRLMASMRILRMEIPMNFTMEFFEAEIVTLATAQNTSDSARARITVFRNPGGLYNPVTNNVSYCITTEKLNHKTYQNLISAYEVDLFKDFYVAKNLLSTLKTNNKILNITASIFAAENGLQNCLLINETKNVVEATNGNLFMLLGNKLITPPLSEGCLNGILRKQVIKIAQKMLDFDFEESPISPFDLQKADEIFITNVISGVQPITKYRKKEFTTNFSAIIVTKLNELIASN